MCKGEHIAKVKIPNIPYSNQHINIKIPDGSKDQAILLYTIKITFNLDIEPTDKTHSIAKSVSDNGEEKGIIA